MATKVHAPERSHEQRVDALKRANRIRMKRADLKRELKAGRVRARELLLSDDPDLATWKLMEVLLAVPKVGRVKANWAINRCRVSPSKTLGGMTDRQRRELLRELPLL